MRLRVKLALMLVAAVVPVVLLFSAFRYYAEREGMRGRVASQVSTRRLPQAQRACEREPESFYLQGYDYGVYAYRPDLTSANPEAPPVPEPLAEQLAAREEPGVETVWGGEGFGGETIGATALQVKQAERACSVFVFTWRSGFGPPIGSIVWRVFGQSGIAALVLMGVGLLVGGPFVRRIRRLTREVEEGGGEDYRVEAETDAGDEIGDLARAFNRAGEEIRETIDELQARDRALREYVANTTHDLAVPVTVLQHRLTKLKRRFDEEAVEPEELIDSALEEAQYLSSMVSSIGALARLDAGDSQVSRHEVDLREVVERVGARFEQRAEQKQIDFNWAVPDASATVEADSTLVEQAIGNCVQNAIQYNVAGGHVALVLDRIGDEAYEIGILDDGPGVPEATLDRLTERRFRDRQARSRRPNGHGLGLSITRRIVELHDWELSIANREQAGLEVRIRVEPGAGGEE